MPKMPDVVPPEPELTGADVFGEPVEGEAVTPRYGDPLAGYTPRSRWGRRSDGRPVRLDDAGRVTTQGQQKGDA